MRTGRAGVPQKLLGPWVVYSSPFIAHARSLLKEVK